MRAIVWTHPAARMAPRWSRSCTDSRRGPGSWRAQRPDARYGRRRRMTATRRPQEAPVRAPLVLIAIALLSGSLAAGILLRGLDRSPGKPAHASGLRAEQLPGDLDGRAAPAFRLRDPRGGVID